MQGSYQKTGEWLHTRFSQLVKVLEEKQEVTESHVSQEQEAVLTQAQAQLDALQEQAQRLRQSHQLIDTLRTLPDNKLIQVSVCVCVCNTTRPQAHTGQCVCVCVFVCNTTRPQAHTGQCVCV